MHVERLPRRLWYRWTEEGEEIEYPTDLPTPTPEIKCDSIITTRETYPQRFVAYGRLPANEANGTDGSRWGRGWTFTPVQFHPVFHSIFQGRTYYRVYISWQNPLGITRTYAEFGAVGTSWHVKYFDFSVITETRNDLLVGNDRIINPSINTPCPKWRFTGGNCPPGSQDCGNCCLDCASLIAELNAATASVLPFSIWRPKL